jgi:rod shape determining protein RodA
MRERSIFGVDILLMVATLTLLAIGVLFIYSSGVTSDGVSFSTEWIRQLVWVALGVVLLIAISAVDYGRLRDLSMYFWGGLLVMLIGTLLFGQRVNGARSWFGIGELGIQPSEFMKIATVLFLASYLEKKGKSIQEPLTFIVAFGIVLAPMALILIQPDLGTALVYLPIFLVMSFCAGARPSYLLFILLVGALTVVFTVLPAWETLIHGERVPFVAVLTDSKLVLYVCGAAVLVAILGLAGVLLLKRSWFRWFIYSGAIFGTALLVSVAGRRVLKDYQLMRLIVFLDPNVDPRGAGWNIIQSVTAVGSGGIAGKGWLQGTQSHLQYLPQQSTDFIFSIIAEEWGFLGAALVFVCFAVILGRGLVIAAKAKDRYASFIAVGVISMIFFHVAVNIGMAIGIMPITGIPLMFLSYGGSSLSTAMIGVGLLISIYNHRYRY